MNERTNLTNQLALALANGVNTEELKARLEALPPEIRHWQPAGVEGF